MNEKHIQWYDLLVEHVNRAKLCHHRGDPTGHAYHMAQINDLLDSIKSVELPPPETKQPTADNKEGA